jgi:hypothetical protein
VSEKPKIAQETEAEMSGGPGCVERAIAAAFMNSPDRVWNTYGLAELAYPGETIDYNKIDSVRRAADKTGRRARLAAPPRPRQHGILLAGDCRADQAPEGRIRRHSRHPQ